MSSSSTSATSTRKSFETLEKVVDLTREAFESQIRLGADFADVAQHALKEGNDPIDAGRTYLESAWREAANYWQAVADLNVRYATHVVRIGTHAVGRVLADVDAAVTKRHTAETDKPTEGTETSATSQPSSHPDEG
jgi:hypothetical protein